MRCLRLLEAIVWPALAVALFNWTSLAAPLCLFVIGVAIAAPIGRPWIDEVPRGVTAGASCALFVGLASDGLTAGESWNRILVVFALCLAVGKAGGFSFRARPRWAWIAVAFAATLTLFALDHQRAAAEAASKIPQVADILAAAVADGAARQAIYTEMLANLRQPDRLWWVWPVLLAGLLPVGRFVAWRGLAFIRRRDVGRSRKAWFRHPANLSSD
ncbi:hypothetical protein [Caulobacter endophyticus]|uniref:Uncharacterized protein n=1 Tax=Caulobacter endophyticus TaxID=2172652 RepID=A0A2T9K2J3_9CAUL|nr:hypothetical protein [Caulobacter endophyticus]PVM90177.1 hypothetical protein DDF67_11285 [Caulobacter endophyticus]